MVSSLISAPLQLAAPQLEEGSTVEVSEAGQIRVLNDASGQLRWELGMGAPVSAVAVDGRRLYVASGRFLRALSGGASRWALDLGRVPSGLQVVRPGLVSVQLGESSILIDGGRGRFCTAYQPCQGVPSYSVGQIGVPFLDLPGLGVPGLGLVLNPQLFDPQYGVVAPGYLPGFAPVAPSAPPVHARDLESGTSVPRFEKGKSGKVRAIQIGGANE